MLGRGLRPLVLPAPRFLNLGVREVNSSSIASFFKAVRAGKRVRRRDSDGVESDSAAVASLTAAAASSLQDVGIVDVGIRGDSCLSWTWTQLDADGAEWLGHRLLHAADEARRSLAETPRRTVRLPSVLGLSVESATALLEPAGLRVDVTGNTNGFDQRVARQEPPAGAPVAPERTRVVLHVGSDR